MKYKVEFQYADGSDKRPLGETYLLFEGDDINKASLPNVGDYIRVEHIDYMSEGEYIEGKVRSRFFQYVKLAQISTPMCIVNVVVEATDDDFGMILKM